MPVRLKTGKIREPLPPPEGSREIAIKFEDKKLLANHPYELPS